MAITKTNFINYTRCPRFFSLDKVHKEKLDAVVNYKDYKEEELLEQKKEMLSSLYEDDDYEIDVTKKIDPQMEAMMPYYKQVEIEAGRIAEKTFGNRGSVCSSVLPGGGWPHHSRICGCKGNGHKADR